MTQALEALALLAWLWAGARVAAALLPDAHGTWPRRALVHVHGTLLGLGAAAACWFLRWFVPVMPAMEALVATAIGVLVRPRRAADGIAGPTPGTTPRTNRWLAIASAVILVCAAATFVLHTLRRPHGEWDAWAIWNLRARFLHADPGTWALGFSSRESLPHADYPLLVPATVARLGRIVGGPAPWVCAAVAAWFTMATPLALWSWLATRCTRDQAHLATIVVLGIPAFTELGAAQYADVPLALAILLALAPLTCPGPQALGLAGLMAGCAAWTKNEGLVVCVTLPLVVVASRRSPRSLGPLLLGLLPLLLVVVAFKGNAGQGNDLVHRQRLPDILRLLSEGGRHVGSALGLLSQALRLGNGLLVASVAFASWQHWRSGTRPAMAPLTVLLLQLCAYHLIYVVTPLDQETHLRTSADRLLLQLVPALVLSLFLVSPRTRAAGPPLRP